MSHIDIRREHRLGVAEARERIKLIERELDERFKAWLDWDGQRARVMGRGVQGTVEVDDALVRVRLDIGLLFRPLTRIIAKEIEGSLDRAFGTARAQ